MTKNQKGKKERKNPNSGKLGIRPNHPRRQTVIEFSMVGGLWVVVLSFKFDQNPLSGYQDVKDQNLAYCITLANGLYSHTGVILLFVSSNIVTNAIYHSCHSSYG